MRRKNALTSPRPFLFLCYCLTHTRASAVGTGFPLVRAPGARVLPGYKPTNGVLTAAALLHCRRAETNRIQSLRCARLPLSVYTQGLCTDKKI